MKYGGSLRAKEMLVVRKTGNYVTYISACVLYVHIQSSTSRVKEASPERKPSSDNFIAAGPVFRPLYIHTACSTEKDEGDLSKTLQQRGEHICGKDCRLYPAA
jgi:hypothetical protein